MWKYPRPDTWQSFEQILVDWVQHTLGDSGADRYGRNGQRQNGIDILARDWSGSTAKAPPKLWAIQAKQYDETSLTPADGEVELAKAMARSPSPDIFVLATTANRDTRLQDWAIDASRRFYPTRVEVWFWDNLVEQCLKHAWFRDKYLSKFWEQGIPHQLPSPPHDFTGRGPEIAELISKADEGTRTFIVSGMPGVGKTAMGLAIAERLLDRYPDGQLRVDMRGTDANGGMNADEVMLRVIRGLNTNLPAFLSSEEIEPLYHSTLHKKRVLILLDNARDTDQIRLLIPARDACLVVTTRQRMVLPGAHTLFLHVLSPSSSAELLSRICPRVQEYVEQIAKLCGHLPLALRLGGTALAERPDLAVDEYVRRLEEERTRLAFVDATAELSFQLLPADLRKAWSRVAVFPSPFGAEAAAAVLEQTERAASEVLADLVRQCLVEWDPASSRYSLHELLRLVADARLSASERERTYLLHAQYFERRLRAIKGTYRQGGESSMAALRDFDLESVHVKHAMDWVNSRIERGRTYRALCSAYLDAGVDILPIRWDADELVMCLRKAVKSAQQLNDTGAVTAHLGNLGVALQRAGLCEEAIVLQEEVLRRRKESGDGEGIATPLGNLANLYLQKGDFGRGIQYVQESIAEEQRRGNRKGIAADLNTLGNAYHEAGEHEKAFLAFAQSLQLKRELGDRLGEANTWASMGRSFMTLRRYDDAASHFSKATVIFEELGYKRGEVDAREGLCLAYLQMGLIGGLTTEHAAQLAEAPASSYRAIVVQVLEDLGSRAALARDEGKESEYASVAGDIGLLKAALGDDEAAAGLFNESIAVAQASGSKRVEANALFNRALSLLRLSRTDEAIQSMRAAHQIYGELGLPDVSDSARQLRAMSSIPTAS